MNPLKYLCLVVAVLTYCSCYLQLRLEKHELRQSLKTGAQHCITTEVDKQIQRKAKQNSKDKKKHKQDEDDEDEDQTIDDDKIEESQNYKQICYEKDISYSLPMYLNNKLTYVSMDTTVPVSWFKGDRCHVEGSTKKCSLVSTNLKDKIAKIIKKKQAPTRHSSADYAIIEGSSQLVKGISERGKDLLFVTRDSSRMTSLMELLLLGFYMRGEKDTVALENTNFINATQISQNLNYLCDGAISLRFDSASENSFLKQLLQYQGHNQKYVTVSLGGFDNIVAVGEIASKYSLNGYGGIEWMDIKDDDSYGKLPVITDIIIENEGNNVFSQIRDKEYPAVLSLSASYIGIPKLVMAQWMKKFNKKSDCKVDEVTKYMACKDLKEKDQAKIITFEFSGKKVSFTLSQLILGKRHGITFLNMKQTMHDEYAVLGQPFFKKYLVVFDYANNKVGVGQKRINTQGEFINVVSLVRFICFVFVFGCSFILCFVPIKRCVELIKSRTMYGVNRGERGETRRLKTYAPIQENPYDQLNGQVKEVLDSEETTN